MRHFTDVLRDMRNGKVVAAITEQMNEVVRGVRHHGKPGTITLTLKFTPKAGDNVITVAADLKTSIPRHGLPDAIFFANEEGDLLRDDPEHVRKFADAAETHDPETGEVIVNRRAV